MDWKEKENGSRSKGVVDLAICNRFQVTGARILDVEWVYNNLFKESTLMDCPWHVFEDNQVDTGVLKGIYTSRFIFNFGLTFHFTGCHYFLYLVW
jgi:hypothetical protein